MRLRELLAPTARKHKKAMDPRDIARLLNTSPEALAAFEDAYRTHVLDFDGDPAAFGVNSRQAERMRKGGIPAVESGDAVDMEALEDLKARITAELAAQTQMFTYDPDRGCGFQPARALPRDGMVTAEEVNAVPRAVRPQLTGELVQKDIDEASGAMALRMLGDSMRERNPGKARHLYDMFRQGLDILDVDPLLYEVIGMNRNSMGHWLPRLAGAVDASDGFFRIPRTAVAKIPVTLLQLTRLDYAGMTESTLNVVDAWAREVFALEPDGDYFVKTGTYSSKFDFRNARVTTPEEVAELGRYLLYIHFQALQMAGPLCSPCVYGVSTTNEWVVREFVDDPEGNPTIYKGLPLRCEYRAFIDCDADRVLSVVPYWDEEVMARRFAENRDGHDVHDAVTFEMSRERLRREFKSHVGEVRAHLEDIVAGIDLEGQWSVDVMQSGDGFYLIDMALAENSAFYDSVPRELRRPSRENWLPTIG